MKRFPYVAHLVRLFVGVVLFLSLSVWSAIAQIQLTEQSKLTLDGLGPIRVGMTIAQAEKSARMQFIESGGRAGSGLCYYVRPVSGPKGLEFMVISDREDNRMIKTQDRIARVDIWDNKKITTRSGAKIGDTEDRIKSLYPGQIQVTLHKYTGHEGGHYLTYLPKDPQDQPYRLIFETLKGRVVRYRSGKLPEVEYVEGCA